MWKELTRKSPYFADDEALRAVDDREESRAHRNDRIDRRQAGRRRTGIRHLFLCLKQLHPDL